MYDTQTEILHLYVASLCPCFACLWVLPVIPANFFYRPCQPSLLGRGIPVHASRWLHAHFTWIWANARLLSICDAFVRIEEVPCCEGRSSKLALTLQKAAFERVQMHKNDVVCDLLLSNWTHPFKFNNRCQQSTGISTDVTKRTERGEERGEGKNH